MAAFLLAEMRHRHNQKISELRRGGFPVLGHYSTHKIDQLQELYLHNHGCVLYPGWDSASAYKPTDESFDTIALHHSELQDALKTRREQLGDVKLTKDLQYMCDAMGVPLPFLPFSGKEGKAESQLFAKLMLMHKGTLDDVKFALEWCKHVDPEQNIHAKLPCHIRVQAAKFDRNQRIRATMEKAKNGRDLLKELHSKILPAMLEEESGSSDAQADDPPETAASPPSANTATSRKRKSLTAGLSHTLRQPTRPCHFPVPPPQAMHNAPYVQHGDMIIGGRPPQEPKKVVCTLCRRNQGSNADTCPGRGSHKRCRYFEKDDTQKPPQTMPTKRKLSVVDITNLSLVEKMDSTSPLAKQYSARSGVNLRTV
mmetsp:Transcript_32797/g.55526  ORF Transcript_32797/g.55526 Transcript_32797/m.55526 type:complete len:369 (-) Transcript_32797:4-1110(-)